MVELFDDNIVPFFIFPSEMCVRYHLSYLCFLCKQHFAFSKFHNQKSVYHFLINWIMVPAGENNKIWELIKKKKKKQCGKDFFKKYIYVA